MVQIVESQNDYYVCEYGEFYGSFHSLADAETFIRHGDRRGCKHLEEKLTTFNFIKNWYY